jgi:putative transposase
MDTNGLTAKTLQRWQHSGEITEDKRFSPVRPIQLNNLSREEELVIIEVCNEKVFDSLPPSQIVPMLADKGEYNASEFSFIGYYINGIWCNTEAAQISVKSVVNLRAL